MISKSIYRTGWRYLIRHPWQTILMVVGITLGVSVAVSIDLANASAARAFELSTESITGRATHQIVGGPTGLDEEIYARFMREAVSAPAAPVIAEYVSSSQLGDRPLQLIGIDPFSEAPFRDYLGGPTGLPFEQMGAFLARPGAILIAADLARDFGRFACPGLTEEVRPECRVTLEVGGRRVPAVIVGLLEAQSSQGSRLSERSLSNVLLADIATAQEITGRLGVIDRIDLILPDACAGLTAGEPAEDKLVCPQIGRIEKWLPRSASLSPMEARQGTVLEMTAAFRLNLTALSLLALVVGMFLIYNTMTFSVISRRTLFGTLRSLGVTRAEVFFLICSEAILVGVLSSLLGIALGVMMGQGAVRMVTRTINDLYFVVSVQGIQIPLASLLKGGLLGMLATLLSAAPPAWEAASVPPRAALNRSVLEKKAGQAVLIAAPLGGLLILLGGFLLWIPSKDLVISFVGTFAVIVGFAMLAPLFTRLLMGAIAVLTAKLGGVLGKMAPRNVVHALSRTAVAVAALTIAVSVTIGVSLMVSSFRYTVVTWLGQTLQGDVYISVPAVNGSEPRATIDPQILSGLGDWPETERVDVLRSVQAPSPQGPIQVAATNNPDLAAERVFLSSMGPPDQVMEALDGGAVLASEPLANRLDLPQQGGQITLSTPDGERIFPVAGIYYDYASSQGTILMTLENYQRYWADQAITAAALRLAPGVDATEFSRKLEASFAGRQQLLARPNSELRRDVLDIFDRTFAITSALQVLAMLVAFIGILSALLSWQLDKQREVGILRSIGLTTSQLWRLVLMESGLLGSAAGLLSLPTGLCLAAILIYIINKRSFGWTLQMQLDPEPFIQALVLSVSAALLASVYPAIKLSRTQAAQVLRSE